MSIRGMIVGTVKDLDLASDGVRVVANIDKNTPRYARNAE